MSGHSKWTQIKHKKAISDTKKGQLFSKLVKEIMVAVRVGGTNLVANPRLQSAINHSRAAGLPKDNIERVINRASGGEEGKELHEFLYEVVKGGVKILIEGITDNKNRTLGEVKQILSSHDAKFVTSGSLLWNFEKVWTKEGRDYRSKTLFVLPTDEQEKILSLLDALLEHNDVQEVYTNLAS